MPAWLKVNSGLASSDTEGQVASLRSVLPATDKQNATYTTVLVGSGRTPVVIADNFHPAPDKLRAQACGLSFTAASEDYYPGVLAPAHSHYQEFVNEQLPTIMGVARRRYHTLKLSACRFSLATRKPGTLKPIQCVPHFDAVSDNEWAMVHYLSLNNTGGTAFYRHRDTAFEKVTSAAAGRYLQRLKEQATTVGFPANDYIRQDTRLFKHIAQIEWAFNRAIFYPSNLFHSGVISASTLSEDPATGRLTGNACIQIG